MKRVKRWLVIVVALFVGGTVLVARPAGEEDAAEGADKVVMEVEQGRFREAPMLVGLVQSGNLPAVDERLPTDPLVWPPPEMEAYEEGIGEYGGVLRLAHERYPLMLNEYLQMGLTKLEFDGFVPLLAKNWEFSSDYRTVTFYLREGIKWSDGEPFTANDIMFWWNDLVKSKYLTEPLGTPGGLNPSDDNIVMLDDYTLRIVMANPNPKLLFRSRGFAGGEVSAMFRAPAHYLKQFHPDYSPQDGVDSKEQFLTLTDKIIYPRFYEDNEHPVLTPWKIVAYEPEAFARMERNPYFWIVDKAGNQLPYIDYLDIQMLTGAAANLQKVKALAGDVDVFGRGISVLDYPLIAESTDKTGLELVSYFAPNGSISPLIINVNHPDPEVRAILRNSDFRRALSMAVDRELINETALLGLGTISHGFSGPGVYEPEIDGKWIEYEPARAQNMLDAIGMDEKDDEGYRLLPNGDKFTFILMYVSGWGMGTDEIAEIATQNWREIGIRSLAKPVEHRLRAAMMDSEEGYGVYMWPWSGRFDSEFTRLSLNPPRMGNAQWQWWQNRDKPVAERPGEEPVGSHRRLFELYDLIQATTDETEAGSARNEYRTIVAQEMLQMGFAVPPWSWAIHKDLGNVWGRTKQSLYPEEGGRIWQWYWKTEERRTE